MKSVTRICFVCLGNICRSPTAEGVMQYLIDAQGLASQFELDSAGTGSWHIGERADGRARAAAAARGIDLQSISRKVRMVDFEMFDYLIAMDSKNLRDLMAMRATWKPSNDSRPKVFEANETGLAKLAMLRTFDAASPDGAEVPDPYYGGDGGFQKVLDICERGCSGLLQHIRSQR